MEEQVRMQVLNTFSNLGDVTHRDLMWKLRVKKIHMEQLLEHATDMHRNLVPANHIGQ